MWIVGKIKNFQLETVEKNLRKKEKEGLSIDLYVPRFVFTKKVKNKFKKIEKYLLDNYIFINLNQNSFDVVNKSLKFTKGLSYILQNFNRDQESINKCFRA